MMLDRRPEHYGLEAKHAYDLWHAGIVRVLDRTRWHDPAGPSLAGLAFSSSEACMKRRAAITTRTASARYTERSRGKPSEFSTAVRLVAPAADAVAGQQANVPP